MNAKLPISVLSKSKLSYPHNLLFIGKECYYCISPAAAASAVAAAAVLEIAEGVVSPKEKTSSWMDRFTVFLDNQGGTTILVVFHPPKMQWQPNRPRNEALMVRKSVIVNKARRNKQYNTDINRETTGQNTYNK